MKRRDGNRRALTVLVICLLTFLMCGTSLAATNTINGVTVRVGLNVEAGSTLPSIAVDNASTDKKEDDSAYVGTNSEKYDVRDAVWDDWETDQDQYLSIGEQPRMAIYLEAEEGYTFRSSYSSSSVTVKGGKLVRARRDGDGILEVIVALNPVKGQYLAPYSAEWSDGSFGRAVWDMDIDYDDRDEYYDTVTSGYYDVYLYRGNTIVHKLEEYHGTSYNFYPYMTKRGTYRFQVRTVPHTTAQKEYGTRSEWVESDDLYVDEDEVSDGSGREDPQERPSGRPSGTPSGTTQVGWIFSDGTWYFRYPDGKYQTNGWLKLNNIWYLFDSSGRMLTGWQQVKGLWYYMQPDGAMVTGWLRDGNYWYYLNTLADGGVEGSMRTGWLVLGGRFYYLNDDGTMVEGWRGIDGTYRYFYPGSGYMATNTWIDTYFYVDGNGIWQPNP